MVSSMRSGCRNKETRSLRGETGCGPGNVNENEEDSFEKGVIQVYRPRKNSKSIVEESLTE